MYYQRVLYTSNSFSMFYEKKTKNQDNQYSIYIRTLRDLIGRQFVFVE